MISACYKCVSYVFCTYPASWDCGNFLLVLRWLTAMGVDHGRGQGGQVPPEFGAGDANANCPPPQILSYEYKNKRSVAFKIRQNSFSPDPAGELTTLPQTP